MSRTSRKERLREQAILYEQEVARTGRQPTRQKTSYIPVPPPDETQRVSYPALSRCLNLSLEFRCSARDHKSLKAFMAGVLECGDELVLLTQQIDRCEGLSLFNSDHKRTIRQASRATVYRFLSVYAQRTWALSAVIQKDREGRIHHHCLLPLSCLPKTMRQQLEGAQRGRGGGTVLGKRGELHGVLVNPTPLDLERLARYLSRFADDRLNRSTFSADRLHLLEELAIRQLDKTASETSLVRLAWTLPRQWMTILKKDNLAEKRRQ